MRKWGRVGDFDVVQPDAEYPGTTSSSLKFEFGIFRQNFT